MMDERAPDKKSRLLWALEQGMTMVHLDARRPGVIVPAHLKNEAHLLLNLSYRFDPPDLSVGEWGVRSTLTFSGTRFTVAVPWSALYAISSHVTKEFWMYPEDMPPELSANPQAKPSVASVPVSVVGLAPVDGDDGPKDPVPAARAVLREVIAEVPPGEAPPAPTSPPKRGHLRLVK